MTDTLDARMPRMRDRHPLAAPAKPLTRPAPAPEIVVEPARKAPRVGWERVGADCYAVLFDSALIGFVDVAGTIFVALAGCRYDHAVEVGQSVVFECAVDAVVAAVVPGSAV